MKTKVKSIVVELFIDCDLDVRDGEYAFALVELDNTRITRDDLDEIEEWLIDHDEYIDEVAKHSGGAQPVVWFFEVNIRRGGFSPHAFDTEIDFELVACPYPIFEFNPNNYADASR